MLALLPGPRPFRAPVERSPQVLSARFCFRSP
jgi:hypothetical protein